MIIAIDIVLHLYVLPIDHLLKDRPNYVFKGISDSFSLSEFTNKYGSFHIVIEKSNSKVGVLAQFSIHLQIRELEVLKSIANYSKGLYNTYKTEGKITTILKSSISLLDKITNLKVTKSILQNSRKNPSYIILDILYNSSLEKI